MLDCPPRGSLSTLMPSLTQHRPFDAPLRSSLNFNKGISSQFGNGPMETNRVSHSARCEQPGGFHGPKEEFNGAVAVVSCLTFERETTTMRITTITLAIAFALPITFALARGGMHIGSHVTRPFANPVGMGRIAREPRNMSGNMPGPIAHDPSGSTLTGAAMNRTSG